MDTATAQSPQAQVATLLNSLKDLLASKPLVDMAYAKFGKQIADDTEILRQALMQGATTGDPVKDLVIMAGYGLDEKFLDLCWEVRWTLMGKHGQLVLVPYCVVEEVPTSRRKRYVEVCRFALLGCNTLVLDCDKGPFGNKYTLSLETTGTYYDVRKMSYPPNGSLLLGDPYKGKLFAPYSRHYTPPELRRLLCPEHPIGNWKERLVIGNSSVEDWLKLRGMAGIYQPVLEGLQRPSKQTAA